MLSFIILVTVIVIVLVSIVLLDCFLFFLTGCFGIFTLL